MTSTRSRSLAVFVLLLSAAPAAARFHRPMAPAAPIPKAQAPAAPVLVHIEMRVGTLTVHAGATEPLYTFVGRDGRRIDAVNLATIQEFDPVLHDLLERCLVKTTRGASLLLDASAPRSPMSSPR